MEVHGDMVDKRRHVFIDLEVQLSVSVSSVEVKLQDGVLLVRGQVGVSQAVHRRLEHTHEHL